MKIAVAATAPFGAAVLEGMANRGYDIELLLTRPDKPQGRGRKKAAPPAKEVAKRLEIPVQQPEKLTAFPGEARVVVVAGYGILIPERLLGERLWLNVHPSLLPRWDGATYADKLTAADRELDWERPPQELLNQIRALSPHVGARGLVEGRRLLVWKARPVREDSLLVADGLELLEVQREGGKRMTSEE